MKAPHRRAFTLVEMLVSLAILGILFSLLLRPLMLALEVLSIGTGEQRAQRLARSSIDTVSGDLQSALRVYPNLATFDLSNGNGTGATARWRTAQTARLDLVPAARDSNGKLITPVRPAYANNNPSQPLVISYWRMRNDPTKDYEPQTNPYRLWRAIYAYSTTGDPATDSPDALWQKALSYNKSLSQVGTDLAPLFIRGGAYDWFVSNLDRRPPADTDTDRILRAPTANAAYTNATRIGAVTAVTDLEADVRDVSFKPALTTGALLRSNDNCTAYKGGLGRWVPPYQRESDGQWTLPSGDVVAGHPVVASFRASGSRSALLGDNYVVSVEQDPNSAKVGHPVLYRLPSGSGSPVRVYDLTDYPKRVFGCQPGCDDSGEFACGIDWASGEVVTAFPQCDVICPDSTVASARIQARIDPTSPLSGAPIYGADKTDPKGDWQSLPLTYRDNTGAPQVGVNGAMLDDYLLDASGNGAGVWNSYTLSAFRPERLHTGTDLFNAAQQSDRSLDMSIVPGSEQVVVWQYDVANVGAVAGAQPVRRVVYTPLKAATSGAGGAGGLQPFKYNLDASTGRLTFYDPQLDSDATTARDGLNPPAVVAGGANGWLVPVVCVTYEYRNNLPTLARMLLGDTSTKDVVDATYRSLESIELALTLDVPVGSTRGDTETYTDPLATSAVERPTGARKRVTVQTTLPVGSRL